MNTILYFQEKAEIRNNSAFKILIVPKNIQTKEDLFAAYRNGLNFPDYFGNNWDALYDCLIDLSWIDNNTIQIIHDDIPFEKNSNEQAIYLNVLLDVLSAWNDNPAHNIIIYFSESYRQTLEQH